MDTIERDPTGLDAKAAGAKLDAGKSPVRRGLLEYFPRACMAVADISGFGAAKYSWGGWQSVPDGINRYGDAEARHICLAVIQGEHDSDSKKLHAAHEAWNALARLEFIIREQEQEAARLLQADIEDAVASLRAPYTELRPITASESSVYASAFEAGAMSAMKAAGRGDEQPLDHFCTQHKRWHRGTCGGCYMLG